jgi:ribosomal protein S18 acetylase RimI-like enzyme
MTLALTDTDLYQRGAETLVASWDVCAAGARGAAVIRGPGVRSGVFPHGPERDVFNNALLERDLPADARAAALDAMEAAYASASVDRFAAWVHESDEPMRAAVAARGCTVAEATRAMATAVSDLRLPRPDIDLPLATWPDYVRFLQRFDVGPGLMAGVDPEAYRVVIARGDGGESLAAALAFDLDGDRGIYNVGTVEHARRRGLATALTAVLAHDAAEGGCVTTSLQATEMAERLYAAVGFRDLGRFLEYVP